jgi:hypothetical protein
MDTSLKAPLPIGPRLKGRKIVVTGAASGMGTRGGSLVPP